MVKADLTLSDISFTECLTSTYMVLAGDTDSKECLQDTYIHMINIAFIFTI